MKKIVITGALGYSGKYVAEKLIQEGKEVKTITNSLHKANPFGEKLKIEPFNFDRPDELTKSLQGYDVLVNTYWVRFNHSGFNHSQAVTNTKIMIDCAKKAGIKKFIHVSITNPSINSKLEYFRGKAELEDYLIHSRLNYSIIRPAVLFGNGDILINNISWMLKHMPVMGIFGKGDYRLQPIHIDDFVEIITEEIEREENNILNAIGLETFTYKELIVKLMEIFNIRKRIINVSPIVGYYIGKFISFLKHDVTITREEIKGLMDDLLYVDDVPKGKIKLTEWAKENKNILGEEYASELSRRR
ncbi:MAG: NAD(P)H-binding protein [Flavobacteriaceae bacterium]|jgi:NADH dehydrogenase|nr:NAD(P)H-binding protein [Flavobacteriaceae bacterium]